MKNLFIYIKIILVFCAFSSSEISFAQLGFCQGNSGDPIFVENFGTGLTDTALPAGTTTYTYANGGEPIDGRYTVSSNTNYFDWFSVQDHTPSDTNGRMLVVNSASAAGEFYRTTINGLCENTSYEFSSWILNLTPANGFCGAGAIPVNVRFEIWDNTDTNLLASGNTGNIISTFTPIWDQYALVFQTIPSQTSVILKMINNGAGGCGNDLAIDDIVFKSCGDFISVTDNINNTSVTLCSGETPYSTTLTAIPDNTVFNNHFYQWQESPDENTWTDITGATSDILVVTGVTTSTYYRAKVAESASNLSNSDCITFSSTYEVIVNQAPNAPTIECWEIATLNTTTCLWEISGTQPIEPTGLECWEVTNFNTTTCSWEISGTQPVQPTTECWETATFNTTICDWEITGTQPIEPTELECWEATNFNTTTCNWEISGTQPVQPTTECWETATFNSTTCDWEITGTQPIEPTGLECGEIAVFNTILCVWEIDINGAQIITNTPTPLEQCDLDNNGFGAFDLESKNNEITGGDPSLIVSYHETITDADNNLNPLVSPYNNTTEDSQTVYARVESLTITNNCAAIVELTLIINPIPVFDLEDSYILCVGLNGSEVLDPLVLDTGLSAPTYTFEWLFNGTVIAGATAGSYMPTEGGMYTVNVTDVTSSPNTMCVGTDTTEVIESAPPTVVATVTTDAFADTHVIEVSVDGPGDYEYSLDNGAWQDEPIFVDVSIGEHVVTARDKNGCGEASDDVVVMDYPKFFTPNGDGYNDTWNISAIHGQPNAKIYIFDRYGKLLKQLSPTGAGWNGTYNGNQLPTSDYWFVVEYNEPNTGDRKEFKAHFTLKR